MAISAEGLDLADPLETHLELMRGPAGKWREDRDFQLAALDRLGLRSDHRFLEIGCGPLLAGAALIRFLDPGGYTGVDVRPDHIEAGRKLVEHFGLESRAPRLVTSNDFGRDRLAAASFDRIWCYQVVIHFSQPLVERFMAAVSELLAPGGTAWFSARVTGEGEDFKTIGSWLEFPVTEAGEAFYRTSAQAVGLSCTGLDTLGDWGLPSERSGAGNWLLELRPLT